MSHAPRALAVLALVAGAGVAGGGAAGCDGLDAVHGSREPEPSAWARVAFEPAGDPPGRGTPAATPGATPRTEPTPPAESAPAAEPPEEAPATPPPEPGFDAPLFGRTFHFLARVFPEARTGARPLGYLRRGARFRAGTAVEGEGCARGWHGLPEGGFVCAGEGFAFGTRPPEEPLEGPAPPDESEALPYAYARTTRRTLEWSRLPSASDLDAVERWRACLEPDATAAPDAGAVQPGDDGVIAATDAGPSDCLPAGARGVLDAGWFPSLDRSVLAEGGARFQRTVRGTYVADADLVAVEAPGARGRALTGVRALPLAFVVRDAARVFQRAPGGGPLQRLPDAGRGAAIALAREPEEGAEWLVARDGRLLRPRDATVARAVERPAGVAEDARWVHVDVTSQTLVAYEGDAAVFATVVSTGRDTYATPQGLFRIQSKHVTTTMDGGLDDPAEEAYRIDDVPWVQYFEGGYALHGAFWHDAFGRPKSHGCVNLSPADARWLFRWSTPPLPAGWHGRLVARGEPATWVFVTASTAP